MNDLAISLEQYNALFDSSAASLELRSAAWGRMHDTMLNRMVFFLHKGELRLDSRGHHGLAHRTSVDPERVASAGGDSVTLTFTLTNTVNPAQTVLPAAVSVPFDITLNGAAISPAFVATPSSPVSVAPNATTAISVTLPATNSAGIFVYTITLSPADGDDNTTTNTTFSVTVIIPASS